MNKSTKNKIKNSVLGSVIVFLYRRLRFVLKTPHEYKLYKETKHKLDNLNSNKETIFYIGVPAHANLGDMAQGVCIRRWLNKHYSNKNIVEIETNALVNTKFSLLNRLKSVYRLGDMIVFQSGYTTTDLGGYADEMHCKVIETLPNANILMMPQTIFFQSNERKQKASRIYSTAQNMLFLSRDKVSYDMAIQMFPTLKVLLYPDIVTTLIGTKNFSQAKDGIMFCCRDDSEKFYSDEEIGNLMQECSAFAKVERTDTTKKLTKSDVAQNAINFIDAEIEQYSKYKLIITDRYHGTIFSLIANTPVIVIKTTDHKVTTGTEWFKGVYDDYVYLADSLEEARYLAEKIYNRDSSHVIQPYFEAKYYDNLPKFFTDHANKI